MDSSTFKDLNNVEQVKPDEEIEQIANKMNLIEKVQENT